MFDVAVMEDQAGARERVAALAIDGEVRFASAADRPGFAEEPAHVVSALHRDATAEGGREHRAVTAVHPSTLTAARADQDTMED